MDILQTVVNYVLNDLGAAVFVPLLMLIIGLLMKMKFSEAFHSALTLGVAFSGMGLLIVDAATHRTAAAILTQ